MKLYFCLTCGSTNLWRDAARSINTDDVVHYDNVSCGECSYDGSRYASISVPEGYDIDFYTDDDGRILEEIKHTCQEEYL